MPTTVGELRKAYPSCMTAIGYVEMFLCIPPPDEQETAWELLTKEVNGKTLNPKEVIEHIRLVLHSEIGEPECELPHKVITDILEQIQTPKFLHYIKGKMGAV